MSVTPTKFTSGLESSLSPYLPPSSPHLPLFSSFQPSSSFTPGTTIRMDLNPGLFVYHVDGEEMGRIEGDEFAKAMGEVYFGDKPVSASLIESVRKGV